MLVLTRKLMERLYIGEDICVTVVRLEGGQVRLGIDAPRHIRVVRGELTPLKNRPEPAPREPETSRTGNSALRIRRDGSRGTDSPPRARSR